jgi:hypothetical protein
MTMKRFYPPEAPVPAGLETGEFILEPLTTGHVEVDYAALMDSREMLRKWSGGMWPADDFTLQGNYEDLEMHQREHLAREAFTFTVLAPDRQECLGCVYVMPLYGWLKMAGATPPVLAAVGDDEAIVRFWVRQARVADGLDERLLETLLAWLPAGWRFQRVFFRANDNDSRQVALLAGRAFVPYYSAEFEGLNGRFILYLPVSAQQNNGPGS